MKLRAFTINDAATILSWIDNKTDFRKWSADRYESYPAQASDMAAQYDAANIFPLTAEDDNGNIVGHIMIRVPDMQNPSRVRLGFVIVDSKRRGCGLGKELIKNTIEYAKREMGAKDISLGVFINNPSALHCYQASGFEIIGNESYIVDGEQWDGVEMQYKG